MKASRVIRRCATILSQRSVSLCALPQLNQLIPSHVTSIPMTTRSLTTSVPLVQARPPSSHPILTVPHRTMFIQTQTTPNPRSLKFIPGKPVLPDVSESGLVSASFDLNAKNAARKRCPLAWTLLLIDGVNNVMLGSDFVSVTISDSADWLVIKPQVFAAISEAYASGEPLLKSEGGSESEAQDSKTNLSNIEYAPEDEEAVRLIADIIDLRVRPSVMEDGGDVEFVKFDSNKIVWLKMMGKLEFFPTQLILAVYSSFSISVPVPCFLFVPYPFLLHVLIHSVIPPLS